MLFVAVTAVIIFPIPLPWAMAIGLYALCLYLLFQLQNPDIGTGSVLAGTLFFVSGVAATVVARRTATLLAHKTFLLELRDRMRVAELTDANGRLELLARTNPLTGIANRRWMIETLDRLWNAGDSVNLASILMCDVDHFKHLNDCLGHAEGDRCLVKVAGIIQSCMRDERDQVARYGGEEFLVLLPGADASQAKPSPNAFAAGWRRRRCPTRPGLSRRLLPSASAWPRSTEMPNAFQPRNCSAGLTKPCTVRRARGETGQ